MDAQEVFNKIINHMLEGMMIHEQLTNYFDFLTLEGYKHCHDYHYIEETLSHKKIQQYYIEHYNKLIPESQPNIIQVIPSTWYDHVRQDVDGNTMREGIVKGMLFWRNWEYETKQLYEQSYNILLSINEIAAADKIRELIVDVDEELAEVEKMYLKIMAINTDLTVIIPEQKEIYKEYSNKLKKIKYK